MTLFNFICATVTRSLFVLVALIGVWRVTWVKNDRTFWFLTLLFVPLLLEALLTLLRRSGEYFKWHGFCTERFSPPVFLFLISIIPSMWILEIHHNQNKSSDPTCQRLNSWDNLKRLLNLLDLKHNDTTANVQDFHDISRNLLSVCSNEWILALHQIILILVIVGKWLLPTENSISRGELSQLLLVFVSIAADILEFTNETLADVKEKSPQLVYIILAVWTWSMLQFPLHLAVVNSSLDSENERHQNDTFLMRHGRDIWSILEAFFLQDGPFLLVRVTVMTHYDIFHQMLVFFTIKNFLVVILNIYRLVFLCMEYKESLSASPVP